MTARSTPIRAPLARSARPLTTLLRTFDELARGGGPVTLSRLRQRFRQVYRPQHRADDPTPEQVSECLKKALRRALDRAAAEGKLVFTPDGDDWVVERPGPAPRLKSRRG